MMPRQQRDMDSLQVLPPLIWLEVLRKLDSRSLVAIQATNSYFSKREGPHRLPLVESVAREACETVCGDTATAQRFRWMTHGSGVASRGCRAPWAMLYKPDQLKGRPHGPTVLHGPARPPAGPGARNKRRSLPRRRPPSASSRQPRVPLTQLNLGHSLPPLNLDPRPPPPLQAPHLVRAAAPRGGHGRGL